MIFAGNLRWESSQWSLLSGVFSGSLLSGVFSLESSLGVFSGRSSLGGFPGESSLAVFSGSLLWESSLGVFSGSLPSGGHPATPLSLLVLSSHRPVLASHVLSLPCPLAPRPVLSPPPRSFHPKGGLIGIILYIMTYRAPTAPPDPPLCDPTPPLPPLTL